MVKRNLIFALLIIVTLSLYSFFSPSNTDAISTTVDITELPTYQSKSILTTVYDPMGIMIYKVLAYQVAHYADTNDTYFQQPDVIIYNPKGVASWHISANQACLRKKRILDLDGDVKVINLTAHSQLERITTSSAQINLMSQIVTSSKTVILQGPGFHSTGSKLEGNLRKKTAKLLENVKTFYSSSR